MESIFETLWLVLCNGIRYSFLPWKFWSRYFIFLLEGCDSSALWISLCCRGYEPLAVAAVVMSSAGGSLLYILVSWYDAYLVCAIELDASVISFCWTSSSVLVVVVSAPLLGIGL